MYNLYSSTYNGQLEDVCVTSCLPGIGEGVVKT